MSYREDPRFQKIVDMINLMEPADQVSLHNVYCDVVNAPDDVIYEMCDFDEVLGDRFPSDVAMLIFYGQGFNPNDDFFGFNGYGNLWSSNDPVFHEKIFPEDIARECIERDEDFGDEAIREILDEEVTDDDDT